MNQKTQQQTSSVKNRVLKTIDEKKVTPRPRWEFLIRRSAVWTAGVVSVVVGSLAVAAALFSFVHSGFQYHSATHTSVVDFFLETLPYLWIVVLVIFSGITYYNIRHTENGYRYPLVALVSFSILGSVALGVFFYTLGFGGVIDEKAKRFAPFHQSVVEVQQRLWQDVGEGRIAGSIVAYSSTDSTLVLESFDGKMWQVITEDLQEFDFRTIEMSNIVRVVGVPTTSPDTMYACFVLPWELRTLEQNMLDMNKYKRMFMENERNIEPERSSKCKEVRPYQDLKKLQNN